MNDAGEVLLTIYERVMGVSPEGELLNTIFGLPLSEHVQCHSCGLTTRQSSYMQYFHCTQVWDRAAFVVHSCTAKALPSLPHSLLVLVPLQLSVPVAEACPAWLSGCSHDLAPCRLRR